MIQFNLLPDVKIEYIKSLRLKRSVMMVASIVSAASLGLFIIMFLGVAVFQKQHLDDLSSDIDTKSKELREIKDLDSILTIQNQLTSLTALHDKKMVASRLPEFLQVVTPPNVTIANITVDFVTMKLSVSGETDKISTVNTYVDTLKFASYGSGEVKGGWTDGTEYKAEDIVSKGTATYIATFDHVATSDTQPGVGSGWQGSWRVAPQAFSEVVLASFSKSDKGVNYAIEFKYNPEIFSGLKAAKISVPSGISTRSETEKPAVTFQPIAEPQSNAGGTQ